MSTPFGGHPTFLQYLNWTILVGCTTKHGVAYTDDGGATRLLLIEAPNGNWMAVVGMADSERLLPTTIARFDRRAAASICGLRGSSSAPKASP